MVVDLTDICLDKVCENLDVYISAYKTSEDEDLKRKIELLRRLYSSAIINKKYEIPYFFTEQIPEKHIDFLINKYVRDLDTHFLRSYSWDKIVNKFAEIGAGLETVVFRGFQPWEEIIYLLPNLREVCFQICQNNFLKCISEYCPKLKSLRIARYHEFKNLSLPEIGLKKCSELRKVSLDTCRDENLRDCLNLLVYLSQNLPDLEELEFGRMSDLCQIISNDGMNNLESVTPFNLTTLYLMDLQNESIINDSLIICARLCPRLKSLATFIQNQENLICVSKFAVLQCLNVEKRGDSPVDLDKFLKENGRKFVVLELENFSLSVDNLLRSCLNLTKLKLYKNTFLNVSDDYMPALFNLKFIVFTDFDLDDFLTVQAISSILSHVPNLENLNFNFCKNFLSEMEACVLKCCKQAAIKHLCCIFSSMEAAFVKDVLFACTTLESFSYYEDWYMDYFMKQFKDIALLLPNKPEIIGIGGNCS